MPLAIALSGGGAKGDFEVGALQFLYELGIRPEIVCATSVGSVNGAAIAEGEAGFQKLINQWMSLRSNDDMYLEEPWFKNADSRLHDFTSRIAAHTLNGPLKIAVSIADPLSMILDAVQLNLTLADLNAWVEQAEKAKCLFNLEPLDKRMRGENGLNADNVRTSGIRLRLAVVSLESGELQFVTESGTLLPPGQLIGQGQPVDLITGVLASSGIPLVFPPVKLAGQNYVDGGVREIVPVRAAIELGADRVFVIVASKYAVDSVESFDNKNLLDIGSRAATEIMPNEIVRNETHPFKGWEPVNVKVIQPRIEVHDTLTIEPGLIRIAMAYGYMRTSDVVHKEGQDFYSSAISELRRNIWEWEHDLFGCEHLMPHTYKRFTKFPRHAQNGLIVTDRDTGTLLTEQELVRFIRGKKRELAALVQARRDGQGAVPQGSDDWAAGWEVHNWPDWTTHGWNNPWDRVFGVDAEAPPRLFTLTLISVPAGGGKLNGAGKWVSGGTASVAAFANPGFAFRGWTTADGSVVSANSFFFVNMDSDKMFWANFETAVRPVNDDRVAPLDISPGFTAEFNTANATVEDMEYIQNCMGRGNPRIGKTIWFRFRPASTERVTAQAQSNTFVVVLAVYQDGSLIDCFSNELLNEDETPRTPMCHFEAQVGHTYEIQVGGADEYGGLVTVSLRSGN